MTFMSLYIWVDYLLLFPRPDRTHDISGEIGNPPGPRDPAWNCDGDTD